MIEGKLQADFSSYYEAVNKAIVKEREWDADAAKVEKRLNTMTDGFTGRRVIQEATLMAEAIERSGGVAQLTDAQLRSAGATALEAAEKMKLLGMEVTPGIQSVADAAANLANSQGRVAPASDTMGRSLSQVDKILANMGINIGTEIKGIEQIGAVSGQTVSQLGMLASGAALAGSAFAAWNIGRKVAEFFELDNTIANLTARIMGWGNVTEQEMAAASDVMAKASEIAGRVIRNLTEAIEINEKEQKRAANTSIDWEARMAAARETALGLNRTQIDQIQTARDLGATTEQLKDKFKVTEDVLVALDAQLRVTTANEQKMASIQGELIKAREKNAERVKVAEERTAATLNKLLAENTALEISMSGTARDAKLADIDAEFKAEIASLTKRKELNAETQAAAEQQRDLKKQAELADFAFINQNSRAAIEQKAEFELRTLEEMTRAHGQYSAGAIHAQREKWLSAQDDVRNWRQVQEEAFVGAGEAVKTLEGTFESGFSAMSESVEATTARARQLKKAIEETFSMSIQPMNRVQLAQTASQFRQAGDTEEQALWRALNALEGMEGHYDPNDNAQYFQMQANQAMLAQLRMWSQGKQRPPGFANGVENFGGGLAYVHKDEMLVNMPAGTDVIPSGRGGGGGWSLVINVMAGLGDRHSIAAAIKDVVVKDYKSLGLRGPIPVGG